MALPAGAVVRGVPGLLLSTLGVVACTDSNVPVHETIALITIDTWRLDHFSADLTPNLWALAARGERYANAWSPIGLTSPSHATMLTGLQPWEHGMEANNHHGYRLPDRTVTWPERAPAGTQTAAFVSAFPAGPDGGLGQGFGLFDAPETGERPGTIAVERALAWLPDDAPAWLWVHIYEPHGPYEGTGPNDTVRYAQEVAAADALLAPLLEELQTRRARIVVAADHGEVLLEETCGRQHERSVSDHVLRVPLFRWSSGMAPAVRTERVGLDIVPSLLDGTSWGRAPLVARSATVAESGICESGCSPGCSPPGVLGRDRVVIDDGGRWVHRPGRGTFVEGRPSGAHRALLDALPAVPAPGTVADTDELRVLGYTAPSAGLPPAP
ncbi:MAG: sulfatase-like hydrolase/transferase [Myxococcota bacterium]|nr:sulfatase-like hydrolase/transferase [Myxococcota bacterium]MEC8425699.1 sulfatase-like hydrolase/transferase [Myxococcota bacterium]